MGIFEHSTSFDSAVSCLNEGVKKKLQYIGGLQKGEIREVRLLAGRPLQIVDRYGTHFITKDGKITNTVDDRCFEVTKSDVEESFRIICEYSVHTHQKEICNGYITLKGGHRAGICGTAVNDGKSISAVKDISSINLRIARQMVGVADKMLPSWVINDNRSLIIAGPPCSGKTTLLRDIAKKISALGKRVSVIDERGEISAVYKGIAQNDLGSCCDVFNAYPKPIGIMTALRVMSPDVIVCDEIGGYEEVQEIECGFNSGTRFILTAHCHAVNDLVKRPQIKKLLDSGEFGCVAFLEGGKKLGNPAKIVMLGNGEYEGNRSFANSSDIDSDRGIFLRQ